MKAPVVEKRLVARGFVLQKGRGKGSHRIYLRANGRFVLVGDRVGEVPKGTFANTRRSTRPEAL